MGDKGDCMFIIYDGEIEVLKDNILITVYKKN